MSVRGQVQRGLQHPGARDGEPPPARRGQPAEVEERAGHVDPERARLEEQRGALA